MLYTPNRGQAIKIQERLKTIYENLGGEYYAGEEAWNFIEKATGVDLKVILEEINMNE